MVDIAKEAEDNGWSKWQIYILEELRRGADNNDKRQQEFTEFRSAMAVQFTAVREDIANVKIDVAAEIAALKVKAGVWGVIGGAIPVSIALLIWLFQSI